MRNKNITLSLHRFVEKIRSSSAGERHPFKDELAQPQADHQSRFASLAGRAHPFKDGVQARTQRIKKNSLTICVARLF